LPQGISEQGSKSRGSFSGALVLEEKRSQRAWEFFARSQALSGAFSPLKLIGVNVNFSSFEK
jgi:hypothetical protein